VSVSLFVYYRVADAPVIGLSPVSDGKADTLAARGAGVGWT